MPKHGPHTGVIVAALILAGGLGCRNDLPKSQQVGCMGGKTIQQVQEAHTDEWMAIPGVIGTAIGQCAGKPCILVFTASDTEQVRRKIPPTVDGYPVVVQYTGEFRVLDK